MLLYKVMKLLLCFLLLMSAMPVWAYEMVIIKAVSKEKNTFITRNTLSQKKSSQVFEGKKSTFTSNNVSIIATALTVTKEFIQWEIDNDYTDIPFRKDEVVTMYDATEHLWALTPEKIKRKYVKRNYYRQKNSLEGMFSFTKGLSESVSEAAPQSADRGGFQVQTLLRKEVNINVSFAYGIRYSRDVINLPETSLVNYRFLGIFEGRYYFDPMPDYYNAQIGLGLGAGYGQSRTEAEGSSIFGTAILLPATKISITFPINQEWDFAFLSAFETLRLDEEDADARDVTTNFANAKVGILFRRHL